MAELFSDALGAPTLPPRRAGFTDTLAAAFGGAPDRTAAFAKGLEARGQYQLRTAQTESALAEAEKRRAEAVGQAQLNDAKRKAYADPNFVPDMPFYAMLATGANDLSNARLNDQEFGNRSILGDLDAAPAAQFAAGQGVQGRVLPRLDAVGGETVNLARDPNTTFMTTSQQNDQHVKEAQIANYQEPNSTAAPGGVARPPAGYRWNANGSLEFIPGGPADPNKVKPGAAALPAATRKAISTNDALLANIDRTIAEVKAAPGSFGLKYIAGDMVNQRIDPMGVGARASVADIGSAKMHDRSGAAITAKEFPRLTPFIPSVTDTDQAIITKLEAMRAALLEEQEGLRGSVPAAPTAPGGAGVPTFATAAEAEAAGLAPGTRVMVGGRMATWE